MANWITVKHEDAPDQIRMCIDRMEWLLGHFEVSCWIAGGAIRSFMSGGGRTDRDIYFRNMEDFEKAKKRVIDSKELDARVIHEGANVLKLNTTLGLIDLVKRTYASPQECIQQFDFTVVCAAVEKGAKEFLHHESFFIDLAARRLVINSLPYPLSTLQRLQKYIKAGFTICNGGLLQIAQAIQKIDFSNPASNHLEYYPDGTPKFVRID